MEEHNIVYSDIKDDLLRFASLKAWFRFLPYEGRNYLAFPWEGEQPRNELIPEQQTGEPRDPRGLHWWFWDAAFIDEIPIDGIGKDIIMRHPISFNCFLRGLEETSQEDVFFQGWEVIVKNNPKVPRLLEDKYPHVNKLDIFAYAAAEHEEQVQAAAQTILQIFTEMEEKCPEWLEYRPRLRRTRSDFISYTPIAREREEQEEIERHGFLPHLRRKKRTTQTKK